MTTNKFSDRKPRADLAPPPKNADPPQSGIMGETTEKDIRAEVYKPWDDEGYVPIGPR